MTKPLTGHKDAVRCVEVFETVTGAGQSQQTRVISASLDRTVMVWEVAIQGGTAKLLHKLEGHSDGVDCVALSPDRRHVASASRDKTVRIWDLMAGQQVAVLEGHSERVTSVAWPWSDGGVCLVSGSYDKTVRVWAPDWQPVRLFPCA